MTSSPLLRILGALAAVCAVAEHARAADNMIVNPGFESGDTGGWIATGQAGAFTVVEEDTFAGSFSLKWSVDGSTTGMVRQATAPVLVDDISELSLWARQDNTTGITQAGQLRVKYSDGTLLVRNLQPPAGVWQKFDVTGQLAPGKEVTQISVFVNGGITDRTMLDDFSLMVGDPECDPLCVNGMCNEFLECDCAAGWEGNSCDVDVDECADNPCGANATCSNEPGGFTCTCDAGYTGDGYECTANDDDGDGISDGDDNCPEEPNPQQEDFDEDGAGDLCDEDDDDDGLSDEFDACAYENADGWDANRDGCIDRLRDADHVIRQIPGSEISRRFRRLLLVMVRQAVRFEDRGRTCFALRVLNMVQHRLVSWQPQHMRESTAGMLSMFFDNVMNLMQAELNDGKECDFEFNRFRPDVESGSPDVGQRDGHREERPSENRARDGRRNGRDRDERSNDRNARDGRNNRRDRDERPPAASPPSRREGRHDAAGQSHGRRR